jgi:hypothetical protein
MYLVYKEAKRMKNCFLIGSRLLVIFRPMKQIKINTCTWSTSPQAQGRSRER